MLEKYAILRFNYTDNIIAYIYNDSVSKEKKIELVETDSEKIPGLLKLGLRTNNIIEHSDVMYWISTRVPPPERHNIHGILESFGLKKYDEWDLLLAYDGRSVRDDIFIKLVE